MNDAGVYLLAGDVIEVEKNSEIFAVSVKYLGKSLNLIIRDGKNNVRKSIQDFSTVINHSNFDKMNFQSCKSFI